MERLTRESFRERIFDFETRSRWTYSGERPAVIQLHSGTSGTCRMLANTLGRVSEEFAGQVDVYRIDISDIPDLMNSFGTHSLPSLLFIPLEGSPTLHTGMFQKDAIVEAINTHFKVPD